MVGKSGVVRSAVTLQEWASHQSTRRALLLEQKPCGSKMFLATPDPFSPDPFSPDLVGPPEEPASKPVRVAGDEPGPSAWLEPLLGGPDAGAPRIRVGERGGRDQASPWPTCTPLSPIHAGPCFQPTYPGKTFPVRRRRAAACENTFCLKTVKCGPCTCGVSTGSLYMRQPQAYFLTD